MNSVCSSEGGIYVTPGKSGRKANSPVPVNIQVSPASKDDLTWLQETLGGLSQREVVQRALAGYRLYIQALADGKTAVFRNDEGQEEVILLMGGEPRSRG